MGGSKESETQRRATESRAPRWDSDVDPLRAKSLFELASAGFERRHGRRPNIADLNREFPATKLTGKSGPWNRLRVGQNLPRAITTPQSLLMQRLAEVDPYAAASFNWPLWPLASRKDLTLAEVHGLMLNLPDGVGNLLIRQMPNGRCFRASTPVLDEVRMLQDEENPGGFMGLLALVREAELKQDEGMYTCMNVAMREQYFAIRDVLNDAPVVYELGAYLTERFAQMHYYFSGAYDAHPAECRDRGPVKTILVGDDWYEARAKFEDNWLYGP